MSRLQSLEESSLSPEQLDSLLAEDSDLEAASMAASLDEVFAIMAGRRGHAAGPPARVRAASRLVHRLYAQRPEARASLRKRCAAELKNFNKRPSRAVNVGAILEVRRALSHRRSTSMCRKDSV